MLKTLKELEQVPASRFISPAGTKLKSDFPEGGGEVMEGPCHKLKSQNLYAVRAQRQLSVLSQGGQRVSAPFSSMI